MYESSPRSVAPTRRPSTVPTHPGRRLSKAVELEAWRRTCRCRDAFSTGSSFPRCSVSSHAEVGQTLLAAPAPLALPCVLSSVRRRARPIGAAARGRSSWRPSAPPESGPTRLGASFSRSSSIRRASSSDRDESLAAAGVQHVAGGRGDYRRGGRRGPWIRGHLLFQGTVQALVPGITDAASS